MQINYNKFTEQELRVILKAARTINYGFGLQFPSHKEQLALLLEDEHSPKAKRLLNTWIETNTTKSGNPERAAAVFSGEIPVIKRRDSCHFCRRLLAERRAFVV